MAAANQLPLVVCLLLPRQLRDRQYHLEIFRNRHPPPIYHPVSDVVEEDPVRNQLL